MSNLASLEIPLGNTVNGTLDVHLAGDSAPGAASLREISDVFMTFIRAGELGGYPAHGGAPERSDLTFASGIIATSTGAHVVLNARTVASQCFQLLRHLLAKRSFADYALRRIEVRDNSGRPRQPAPQIDDASEQDLYPPMAENIAFLMDYGEDDFSKWRRVEVEFRDPVGAVEIDLLRPYAHAWGSLLGGGAFALPYAHPDSVDSVFGQITQFDSHSSEIEVPVYLASEEGWNVLINILHTFSKREREIVRVVLE
jgi:hypothetical protein